MTDQWYYAIDDDVRGPVGWDDLRRLARDGAIRPGTMLRRGRDPWVMAQHVRGLFEGIAAEVAPFEEPLRRLDAPPPDEDYRLPAPPQRGGVVTAYGVATLVLAGILTVGGCVSGVGSLFCFAGFTAFAAGPPPTTAPAAGPGAAAAPAPAPAAAGCNGIFAALFWAMALVLAVVTVIHLALAGGHIAAGVGVLRRRPWARILAFVVSFFSLAYGGYALYLVAMALAQSSGAPNDSEGWLVLLGILGVLFVSHAVLTWAVMVHPGCAGEFGPAAARTDYPEP